MKILVDLLNETLQVEGEIHSSSLSFEITFTRGGETFVYFEDLSFNITLKETGEVFKYPQNKIKYFSSDQSFLESGVFQNLVPGKEYTINIKVNESKKTFEEYFKVRTPFPVQPFPSWIYSEDVMDWKPPKPYPMDEQNLYKWQEDTQEWEQVPDTQYLNILSD